MLRPVLLAAALVAGALVSLPAPATAVATAAASRSVVAGETVVVSGRTAGPASRPVALQRRAGASWRTVATARTRARAYRFTVRAPAATTTYRVRAAAVRVQDRRHPAWTSPTRTVAVTAQEVRLDVPDDVTRGRAATLGVTAAPARPGRPVRLDEWRGGTWRAVARATASATGTASFTRTLTATTRLRAVAEPWRGAATVATERTVTPLEPLPPARWVTGYYAGWFWENWYPPERVDMTAMTHFVFGRVAPGAGSLGGEPGEVVEGAGTGHDEGRAPDGRSVEDYLVGRAHAAGTKALLMLGGDGFDGRGFMLSSTDEVRPAFVENVVDYLVAHDYDGVDLDWENCLSGDRGCGEAEGEDPVLAAEARRRLVALMDELRAEAATRPEFAEEPILLTFPGYAVNVNWLDDGKVEPWQAEVANRADQFNLMSYGIGTTWNGAGWSSWFSGALGGASPTTPIDLTSSVAAYVRSGVPRERIGIGIGFYGIYYGPSITRPRQPTAGNSIYEVNDTALAYSELDRMGYLSHGTQRWDPAASSTYRTFGPGGYVPRADPRRNPAGLLSYEDERSIAAKGRWVRSTGVGGTILWTLNYGWLDRTQTNPLLAAVKRAFLE